MTKAETISRLLILIACSVLAACGADDGAPSNASTGGSADELDGSTRALAETSAAGGASATSCPAAPATYCPACEACPATPDPKCVTGAQTACTCTDGSSGAQVCQDDGTMGVCVCEAPPVAPAPVDPFPVCAGVGTMMAAGCAGQPTATPYAYLNCRTNPNPAVCVPMIMFADRPSLGAYCCSVSL